MKLDRIKSICKHYHIYNWELNSVTGLVDVAGDVDLRNRNLTKIPLKFGVVLGYFNCGSNRLKTLENAPKYVKGEYFACHSNLITNLDKGPLGVMGNYYCYSNKLKTNFTKCKIGGYFYTDLSEDGLIIDKEYRVENFTEWLELKSRNLKISSILKKGAT